jgi:hypothetical protein
MTLERKSGIAHEDESWDYHDEEGDAQQEKASSLRVLGICIGKLHLRSNRQLPLFL